MPGAGRPKGSITIADRASRLQMAAAAARHMPAVIKFWADVLAAEEMKEIQKHGRKIMVPKYTTLDRFRASEMAYAFGRPPQAIEGHFTGATKQVLEVRWMPPDPNAIAARSSSRSRINLAASASTL
jgi:hypothetical protein